MAIKASAALRPGLPWIAALTASVLVVCVLALVPFVPTHDGPQHVYLGHVSNHFDDEGTRFATYYEPGTALTSQGFVLLFAPLATLMSWRWATVIVIAVILLVWSWGAFALLRVISRERAMLGVVGFAGAFQWLLYMGFYSFLLSMALALVIVALAAASHPWTWQRRVLLGALLTMQAVSHVAGAAVTCVVLLVFVVARESPRRWLREVGLLALAAVPAMLIAAHTLGVGSEPGTPDVGNRTAFMPLSLRPEFAIRSFVSGPLWRGAPIVLLSWVGLGHAVFRVARKSLSRPDLALAFSSALCWLAALAAPVHHPKWMFLGPRFLPLAVVLGVASLPFERIRAGWPRHVATIGVLGYTLASLGWAASYQAQLDRCTSGARAAMSQPIHRTGPRLPIVIQSACGPPSWQWRDQQVPFMEPLLNIGALYAVEQGGVVAYAFTTVPRFHGFVWSDQGKKLYPDVPDRRTLWPALMMDEQRSDSAMHEARLESLARSGARYRDVIFYGPRRDRAVIERRGFATDFERDELWLAHFVGCPAALSVASGRRDQSLVVDIGWGDDATPSQRTVVPPGVAADPSGRVVVALQGAPCGRVWVRAALDADASGGPSGGDVLCGEADAVGKLWVELSAGAVLGCSMPSVPD